MAKFSEMFGKHIVPGRQWIDGYTRPAFTKNKVIGHQLDREYIPARWQGVMCCTVCGCLVTSGLLYRRVDTENNLIYLMCEGCTT